MTLAALQHILRAAAALAEDRQWLVLANSMLEPATLRQRLEMLPIPVEAMPRLLASFRAVSS